MPSERVNVVECVCHDREGVAEEFLYIYIYVCACVCHFSHCISGYRLMSLP